MLDDMDTLRDAISSYRVAAEAAGLVWPARPEAPAGPPPEQVQRIFDVDHVAEQLTWLYAQPWNEDQVFPDGGWLESWPPDADALDPLHMSVGTPFHWRHQLPLFRFDRLVFTFVLSGDHEGEIWRYESSSDSSKPLRAATSLATLFHQWTEALTQGVLVHDDSGWLRLEDQNLPWATALDPAAFPVGLPEDLLHQRQRECGINLAALADGYPRYEQMIKEVDAVKATLTA